MSPRLKTAFLASLEWRLIAWFITFWYFIAHHQDFIPAFISSLGLQVLLFIGHTLWMYSQKEIPSNVVRNAD